MVSCWAVSWLCTASYSFRDRRCCYKVCRLVADDDGNYAYGIDVLIIETEPYAGFPLALLAVRKPDPEIKDASDTEDDEENEAADDQDEDVGEEEDGSRGDGEGEGDPEDEPEANGHGGSGDVDEDGKEDEEEEDEEKEELQPSAKWWK